jgi:NADPH2:quinone reductase
MKNFRAYRIHQQDEPHRRALSTRSRSTSSPPATSSCACSTSGINFKDALAATGTSPILRRYPLVAGIDFAGEVVSSADPRYVPGQPVLVTGNGLSETHDGGYAEYARVPGDWVIPVPDGLDAADAMRLGTAGFTAALAVHRMEQNGQRPKGGPIVVTGATGGVGSLAINMLAGRGYEVVAVSGKPDAEGYLKELGAARVLRRQQIELGSRPLEKPLWAGAVDNVGGELLTWLTRTTDFWGNIAASASPAARSSRRP